MLFSKKWLKNHLKFLLHFLTHIDVLMLCRKFELIPTSIFRVMILKNGPNFEKNPCTIAHAFFQKMAQKSPKIFITFSEHNVLMLCRKFELIPTSIFRVMTILKKSANF